MSPKVELIVMGGSWGGIQASLDVLMGLPAPFPIPVLLVLHRLRNSDSNLAELYSRKIALKVCEIEEKDPLEPGVVHLAPANYHVLIERDLTLALDVSEFENYSRPSIDVSFASAAEALGPAVVGVLLSGASKDGSQGLKAIAEAGGLALVQDPDEAEIATMPASAIAAVPGCRVLRATEIQQFLLTLL